MLNKCSPHKGGRDFPWGPVVRTAPSNAGGTSLICGQGATSLMAKKQKTKIKKKNRTNIGTNLMKTFEKWSTSNKILKKKKGSDKHNFKTSIIYFVLCPLKNVIPMV